MSIAVLQDKIRARKTPLALVLSPEADKLNPKITKNFTDLYGPGDMAEAEALRYHGASSPARRLPCCPPWCCGRSAICAAALWGWMCWPTW